VRSRLLTLSLMNRVRVWVRPSMDPETSTTAPNSPSTRAVVRVMPKARLRRMDGSVIRQKVGQGAAPRVAAACSASVPSSSRTGRTSRTTYDAGQREDDLDAPGGQPVAEPSRPPVDQDQGQADDDGGHGQGQVDEGVEQPGAPEAVSGQDEGHPHPEGGVEGDGDDHHQQGEAEGVECVMGGDGVEGRDQTVLEGSVEHRPDRDDHQQGQVGQGGHPQGIPPPWCHSVPTRAKRRRTMPMAPSTTRAMATSRTDTAAADDSWSLCDRL
jgi:hypothetical protein